MSMAESVEIDPQRVSVRRPRWDRLRRELWFETQLVKRFRVPATNQELILDVFEEEGWPERIDDPLPIDSNIDSHQRLQTAIKRLNGRQVLSVLRFSGDGRGVGILWEAVISQTNLRLA